MNFTDDSKFWSNRKTLALVEAYKRRPELWHSKNPDYTNQEKKSQTINELAAQFGVDRHEVRRKLKNLGTQYMRERKMFQKMKLLGKKSHKRWFAYNSMKFLASRNKYKLEEEEEPDGEGSSQESQVSFPEANLKHPETTPLVKVAPSTSRGIPIVEKERPSTCSFEFDELPRTEVCHGDPDSLFFQSIMPDYLKLSARRRRKFKEYVLSTLNNLLDEEELTASATAPNFIDCHATSTNDSNDFDVKMNFLTDN